MILAAEPQSGRAPLRVEFTANGSDPDGDRLRYSFDFGDGERTSTWSGRASHRYRRDGVYTAKVTATDTDGATATAEIEITATRR